MTSAIGNRVVVWLVGNLGLGGGETHTLSLIENLSGAHHVICTQDIKPNFNLDRYETVTASIQFIDEKEKERLKAAVSALHPDLLMVIYSYPGSNALRELFPGIPVIAIVHSQMGVKYQDNTMFVFPSESNRENSGIGHLNCTIHIKNGVDTRWWGLGKCIRSDFGFDAADFVVLYAGRIASEKRIPWIVGACAAAGAKLIVAGDGPHVLDIQNTAESLGISDDVRITGYVSPTIVRDLMYSSDCLMLASKYECCPLVILEAMAVGLPVISTPVGDVEEMLSYGEGGYIASTVAEISNAVTEIRLNPSRAKQKADVSLEKVQKEYNVFKMRSLYQGVMDLCVGSIHSATKEQVQTWMTAR